MQGCYRWPKIYTRLQARKVIGSIVVPILLQFDPTRRVKMLGGVRYRDAGAQMQRKMSTGTKEMRSKGDTLFMSPSTGPNLTESDKAIQLQTIRLTTPCRHLAVFVIATLVPMTITIRITMIITLQTSYAYTPLQLITFRIVTSAKRSRIHRSELPPASYHDADTCYAPLKKRTERLVFRIETRSIRRPNRRGRTIMGGRRRGSK